MKLGGPSFFESPPVMSTRRITETNKPFLIEWQRPFLSNCSSCVCLKIQEITSGIYFQFNEICFSLVMAILDLKFYAFLGKTGGLE